MCDGVVWCELISRHPLQIGIYGITSECGFCVRINQSGDRKINTHIVRQLWSVSVVVSWIRIFSASRLLGVVTVIYSLASAWPPERIAGARPQLARHKRIINCILCTHAQTSARAYLSQSIQRVPHSSSQQRLVKGVSSPRKLNERTCVCVSAPSSFDVSVMLVYNSSIFQLVHKYDHFKVPVASLPSWNHISICALREQKICYTLLFLWLRVCVMCTESSAASRCFGWMRT